MPSSVHETLVEIFRVRPGLVVTLLGGPLGQVVPRFEQARVEAGELTDVAPTEYRADAVVTLSVGEEPVLGVVIEVQLRRDPDKRWTWPIYLTTCVDGCVAPLCWWWCVSTRPSPPGAPRRSTSGTLAPRWRRWCWDPIGCRW